MLNEATIAKDRWAIPCQVI